MPAKPPLIAVLAFERISPFHLSVPCVVFGEAHPDVPRFQVQVCAVTPGLLPTSADFSIQVKHGLQTLRRAQVVIVPSWADLALCPPPALLKALQAAHRRGAQIVGLCLGAYVLAQAGLLDGRRATTHWAYAQDFAQRFPQVQVDADVLYIDDGDIVTSAGTAAAIDCCLHMLRQRFGAASANRVARHLVVPPQRKGGQAQFIEQPLPAHAQGTRLAEVIDWVRQHPQQAHTLDSLAAKALLSRRTLSRHFRQTMGMSVAQWLIHERLNLAQQLLEKTPLSIEHIAERAGFGSPVSLRHHFRQTFGVSPARWRETFTARVP